METAIFLIVEGDVNIGEFLKVEKIMYQKKELEHVEITVTLEILNEWREKIKKISRRHDDLRIRK
jgi:hypothetical protein